MKVYITVVAKSFEDKVDKTKAEFENLVINTKKEKACIQYDLHQDKNDPTIFILHEIWENQDGLDLHNKQEYIINFRDSYKNFLVQPLNVYKTNKLL